jgi:hypothetical protein
MWKNFLPLESLPPQATWAAPSTPASAPPPAPPCRRQRGRPGTRAGPKDGGGGASLSVVAYVQGGGAAQRQPVRLGGDVSGKA